MKKYKIIITDNLVKIKKKQKIKVFSDIMLDKPSKSRYNVLVSRENQEMAV